MEMGRKRRSSNLLYSSHCGVEQSGQLVGLITQRSKVRILLPLPILNSLAVQWSGRLPVTQKIVGSNPIRAAIYMVIIVQLARTLDCGSRGHGFETHFSPETYIFLQPGLVIN